MNDHEETPMTDEAVAGHPAPAPAGDAVDASTPRGPAAPAWPRPEPTHATDAAWHPSPPTPPLGADPWSARRGPGVPPPAPWMAAPQPPATPRGGNDTWPQGAYGAGHDTWPQGAYGAGEQGAYGAGEHSPVTQSGYYGGGGGPVPPYSGWVVPPPGEPWGSPQPNRATRRRRARTAMAAGVTAGVLGVAAAGVLIGHATWSGGSSSQSAAASLPAGSGTSGSGTSGSGTSGSGSSGSTSPFGSGSTGSGSTGSGSSGSGSSGSSSPFGSFGSSGSASSSTAAGGPSNAAAIAKKVQAGLVDINTTLGYAGEEAAGTGMVLTSNGEILTNNHVIDGATSIRVTDIANGKTYAATVVGYDRTQDVAVLQLTKASGLTTVTLGNSSAVTKGQAVVGIGNAGGVGGTPSYAAGSVTALGQSITASDEGGGNSEKLFSLIETNADIEAGDSGGSLVNTSGQVIGMDTAASSSAQFQAATSSTSYAIPINEAVGIAKQIESGKGTSVVHIGTTALLGVTVQADGTGSTGYGGTSGSTTSGALVAGVVADTAAANAGLAEGDVITAVGGQAVTSPDGLTTALSDDKPGSSVSLSYTDTSGQSHTVTVHLTAGPPQ